MLRISTKKSVKLNNLDENDISEVVRENLTQVENTLQQVSAKCNALNATGKLTRMAFAPSEARKLESLDEMVTSALTHLIMALQLANYNQRKQIKSDIKSENQEVKNTVYHPEVGLYLNPKGCRPKAVTNLKVSLVQEGDLEEISWVNETVSSAIDYFELYFDDETRKTLSLPVAKLAVLGKKYSIRIGEPQVMPGNMYTIKLQAADGSGPGKWCDSFSFRFKTGPPARPKMPNIVTSTTEVRFEVKKLDPREEHGSPVTHCVVEHMEIKEDDEVE